ncbi:hypothetical protein F4803DRAFT_568196 [Xylaria telfairii]|nr:hypothetical protein F4803DRAFT_568196 [Xylaria telfairii]
MGNLRNHTLFTLTDSVPGLMQSPYSVMGRGSTSVNLYPEHIEAKSANILLENAHDDGVKAPITRALSDLKIRNLVADEKYSGPIAEIFRQDPAARFGVIVSIISCFEPTIDTDKSKEREVGGSAGVPAGIIDAATGVPGAGQAVGDPLAVEGRAGQTAKVNVAGTYEKEVIIACGYVEMSLKEKARHWWKPWGSGQAPSLHDIDINITSDPIHPITMTVFVPPTHMEGDQEPLLGGISDSGPEEDGKQDGWADEGGDGIQPSQELDDETDFVLYP